MILICPNLHTWDTLNKSDVSDLHNNEDRCKECFKEGHSLDELLQMVRALRERRKRLEESNASNN